MTQWDEQLAFTRKQINLEDLMSVSPDWRPEDLLQFSTPRDNKAVHCVQQRGDCQRRQGDRGIVMGYEENWKTLLDY